MAMRNAREIAERAVVMTALAFRSSLEVADHPRSDELAGRLLGWLEQQQLGGVLDPIESEIFAAPRGTLARSQRTDATLAEEGACLFAWAISMGPPLPGTERADARPLVATLRILHSDVGQIIAGAALRPEAEIANACLDILLTLSELRQRRLADATARKILADMEARRIAELGLQISPGSELHCREFVDSLSTDQQRAIAGIQFVRGEAARWLYDGRPSYFETESN
jgi:hypothetical protein